MLKSAVAAVRGQLVSASALWADHAELLRQIGDAEKQASDGAAETADSLIEALASENPSTRAEARRRRREAADHVAELKAAAAAIARRARAAEEAEQKRAWAGAWQQVDVLMRQRLQSAKKLDRLITEIAVELAEAQRHERTIEELIPREQRPPFWPRAGWGDELGRAIALRLKLLAPAIDGLANGCILYAPRDQHSITALVEAGHFQLNNKRPKGELK